MLWILLAVMIIIQHYFANSLFLFWLVKMIEGLIIFDLILLIIDYRRLQMIVLRDDMIYHEGDRFKIAVKTEHITSRKIKYFWLLTHRPSGKTIKIRSKDNYLNQTDAMAGDYQFRLSKVKISSLFATFFLYKKTGNTISIRIYPHMISTDLDSLSGIFEGEDNEMRGHDYTEITGYHFYQPGDDLKHIHHALSAKMDDYVIKEGGRFGVKEYHYAIDEKADFNQALKSCGQVYYLFETYARPNNEKMLIHYQKEYVIANSYDLYAFFDQVYEDYL